MTFEIESEELKKRKKNEHRKRDLWDTIKWVNILSEHHEENRERKGQRDFLEEIIAESLPSWNDRYKF